LKKFFIRIAIFFGIAGAITAAIKLGLPHDWGNQPYSIKLDYLLEHQDEYNTVCIGPSTIVCNIIPEVFDEYTNNNTSTFNLGVNGMMYLEMKYALEHLLENDLQVDNYIFLALEPRAITDRSLHSVRSKYYLDLQDVTTATKYFSNNRKQIYNHFLSYGENLLAVGEIGEIIDYYASANENIAPVEENGFFDLEKQRGKSQKVVDEVRAKTAAVRSQNKKMSPSRSSVKPPTEKQQLAISELKKVAELVESYGKNIYFLYMPNQITYRYLTGHKNIYMGDGRDFPEFFEDENIVNLNHLNREGAELFSKRMGQLYLQQNPDLPKGKKSKKKRNKKR